MICRGPLKVLRKLVLRFIDTDIDSLSPKQRTIILEKATQDGQL